MYYLVVLDIPNFFVSSGRKDVYLMFKGMNTRKTGSLNLEEFFSLYQYCKLKWRVSFQMKKRNVIFDLQI